MAQEGAPSGMPQDNLFQYKRAPKFNPDIQDVLENYDNQNACLFNGFKDEIQLDVLLGNKEDAKKHAAELNGPPSIFSAQVINYDAFVNAIEAGNKELISERITYIRRKRYQGLDDAKKEFLRGRMSDVNLETFMENFYAERTADASSAENKVNILQASIDENEQELLSLQTIQANSPSSKIQRSIVTVQKKIDKEKRDLVVKKEAETESTELKETTKRFLDRIVKMEGETEADYNTRLEANKHDVFDHLYDEFIGDKFDSTYNRYNKIKAAEKGKDKLKVKGVEVVMLPPKGVYLTYGLQQLPFLMDCSLVGKIQEKSILDLNLYITPYFEESGRYQTPNKKIDIVWGIPNDRWNETEHFFPEIGTFVQPSKIGTGIFSAGNPSKAIDTIKIAIRDSMPAVMADNSDNGGAADGGGLSAGGGSRNHEDTAKHILNVLTTNDDLLRVCFFNKDRTIDQTNLYKYRASVMMLQLNPDFNIKNHILASDTVITTPSGKQFKWSFTYSKTTPTHVIFFFMNSGIAYTVAVEVSFRVQSKSLSHIFGDNLEPLFNSRTPIPGINPSIIRWAEVLKASFIIDYPQLTQKPYLLPMVSTAGPASGSPTFSGGSTAGAAGQAPPDIGKFTIDKKWRIMIQAMLDLDKLHDSASYRLKKAGIDEAQISKIHGELIEKVNKRIDELLKELVPEFQTNDLGVPDDFMASIPTGDPLDNFLYRFCGSLRCFFIRDFSSAKYEITVLAFFLKSIQAFVAANGAFNPSGRIPEIQGLMQREGIWADNAARFPRYTGSYPRGPTQKTPVLCNLGTAFDGGTETISEPNTIMINRGIQIVERGEDGDLSFIEYIPKQGLEADLMGKTKKEIRDWFKDSVKFLIHGDSGPIEYHIDPLNKRHNAEIIAHELSMNYFNRDFNNYLDRPTHEKAIYDFSQHFFLLDYGDKDGDVPCGLVQNDLMSGIFEMLLLIATKDELKGVKMVGIWCPVRVLWFRIEKMGERFDIQLHFVQDCLNVKQSEIIEDEDSEEEDEEVVTPQPAPASSSSSSLPAAPPLSSSLSPAAPPLSSSLSPAAPPAPPNKMDVKTNQSGGFTKRKKRTRHKILTNKDKSKTKRIKLLGDKRKIGGSLGAGDAETDLDTICYMKLLEISGRLKNESTYNEEFKSHTVFHVFSYRYLMLSQGILCSLDEYLTNPVLNYGTLINIYDIHFFRSIRLCNWFSDETNEANRDKIYEILLEADRIEQLMKDGFNKEMLIHQIVIESNTIIEQLLISGPGADATDTNPDSVLLSNLLDISNYGLLCSKSFEELQAVITFMIEHINKTTLEEKLLQEANNRLEEIHLKLKEANISERDNLFTAPSGIEPGSGGGEQPESSEDQWRKYHAHRVVPRILSRSTSIGSARQTPSSLRRRRTFSGGSALSDDLPTNYTSDGLRINLPTNMNRVGCFNHGLFQVPISRSLEILKTRFKESEQVEPKLIIFKVSMESKDGTTREKPNIGRFIKYSEDEKTNETEILVSDYTGKQFRIKSKDFIEYSKRSKLAVVNEKISSTLSKIEKLEIERPLVNVDSKLREIEQQFRGVKLLIEKMDGFPRIIKYTKFAPFIERVNMHIEGIEKFITDFNEAPSILHEETSKYSLDEKFEYAVKVFNLLNIIRNFDNIIKQYTLIKDEDELGLRKLITEAKKIASRKITKMLTRKNLKNSKSKSSFNP